ncbi:hypothetical protein [Azospirillum cavernae]|uniref:hypothetical protein n=1 Tax=Azospirillum cavernae TaxID=2320860 RepID=UPI000E6C1D18|nr:hypothetical protein [Azospirillum cavernae]
MVILLIVQARRRRDHHTLDILRFNSAGLRRNGAAVAFNRAIHAIACFCNQMGRCKGMLCGRGDGLAAAPAAHKGECGMSKILTLLILLLQIIKACLDLLNR